MGAKPQPKKTEQFPAGAASLCCATLFAEKPEGALTRLLSEGVVVPLLSERIKGPSAASIALRPAAAVARLL